MSFCYLVQSNFIFSLPLTSSLKTFYIVWQSFWPCVSQIVILHFCYCTYWRSGFAKKLISIFRFYLSDQVVCITCLFETRSQSFVEKLMKIFYDKNKWCFNYSNWAEEIQIWFGFWRFLFFWWRSEKESCPKEKSRKKVCTSA